MNLRLMRTFSTSLIASAAWFLGIVPGAAQPGPAGSNPPAAPTTAAASGPRAGVAVGAGASGIAGWRNYVLGSTLAQAQAIQAAAGTAAQRAAMAEMSTSFAALGSAAAAARNELWTAAFADGFNAAELDLKVDQIAKAELALANARADSFVQLQTSTNRLSPQLVQSLIRQNTQLARAGGARGTIAVTDLEGQVAAGADFSPKPPVQVRQPDEEAGSMIMQPGFHLAPVLWDPYIQDPVQIAFDANGRLFVNEMRSYMLDPADANVHAPICRISMHVDLNGDGVYDQHDRHTVFVDGLVATRYVMPLGMNSVVALQFDHLDAIKYTDTDGDGVADKQELFAAGVGQIGGNVQHQTSGLTWGLDNWLQAVLGGFRLRWTPNGVGQEPSGALGGEWGVTMDNYGQLIGQGGDNPAPMSYQFLSHYGSINITGPNSGLAPGFATTWGAPMIGDIQGGMSRIRMPDNSLQSGTAAAGNDVFRGDRLPADLIGDYFSGETVARIVRRIRPVVTDGLTQMRNVYNGDEFIKSTDPLFRPTDLTTAPDGTLYITDMYHGTIEEATWTLPGYYVRAKIEQYGLDRIVGHGRIFRLTYDGIAPDSVKPNMGNETAAQLVARLEHPNGWWRDTAQQLLVLGQDKSVVLALQAMARTSSSQLGRIHALWTLEGLNALDAGIVREQLQSADPKIRIQAARLAEPLIKAGDNSLIADVKALAKDSDPNVVIQSMLTIGYVRAADAVGFIQSTMAANPGPGVTAVGAQLAANGGRGGGRAGGARAARAGTPALPAAAQ